MPGTGFLATAMLSTALMAVAGCNAVAPFNDCQTDQDCPGGLVCSPARHFCHTPVAEVCGNGRDDDLDGLSDEQDDFGPCDIGGTGSAGCRDGVRRCQNRALICVARTQVTSEQCGNGVDDDCNGVVDDSSGCVAEFAAVSAAAPMTLGSDDPSDGSGADGPAHPVCLAPFALDRTEVSVEAYARFLNTLDPSRVSVSDYEPDNPLSPSARYVLVDGHPFVQLPDAPDGLTLEQTSARGWYPRDARFLPFPMVRVTWQGADGYCRWAGKHLPSEAEWWRAAHGADGARPNPWGTAGADCTRANMGSLGPGGGPCVCDLAASLDPMAPRGASCTGAPLAVTSLPAGASPEGVLNLVGNANEWLHDNVDVTDVAADGTRTNAFYTSVPRDAWCTRFPMGPIGPAAAQPIGRPGGDIVCVSCRMARGRHFYASQDSRTDVRRWLDADVGDATLGFRCASGGASR